MTLIWILLIINAYYFGRAWDEMPSRPFKKDDIFFFLIPFIGFLFIFILAWIALDKKFRIVTHLQAYTTRVSPEDLEKLIARYKRGKNKDIAIFLRVNGVDVKNLGR